MTARKILPRMRRPNHEGDINDCYDPDISILSWRTTQTTEGMFRWIVFSYSYGKPDIVLKMSKPIYRYRQAASNAAKRWMMSFKRSRSRYTNTPKEVQEHHEPVRLRD